MNLNVFMKPYKPDFGETEHCSPVTEVQLMGDSCIVMLLHGLQT